MNTVCQYHTRYIAWNSTTVLCASYQKSDMFYQSHMLHVWNIYQRLAPT